MRSSGDKLSWETSLLVRSEILGLFANALTGDDKYSRHFRETLPQPIQMQLSKKQKFIFKFLSGFRNLHEIRNILTQKISLRP